MKQCESAICPCGSDRLYGECCARYIRARCGPPTALALMRSRYTAHVMGDSDYLRASWHPATRPPGMGAGEAREPVKWLGLEILDVRDGGDCDEHGEVEFIARYKLRGKAGRVHERSRFVKHEGRWLYLEGEQR